MNERTECDEATAAIGLSRAIEILFGMVLGGVLCGLVLVGAGGVARILQACWLIGWEGMGKWLGI